MLRNLGTEIESAWKAGHRQNQNHIDRDGTIALSIARLNWQDYLEFARDWPSSRVTVLRYYEAMEWMEKGIRLLGIDD